MSKDSYVWTFLQDPWSEQELTNNKGIKYVRAGLSSARMFAEQNGCSHIIRTGIKTKKVEEIIDVRLTSENFIV